MGWPDVIGFLGALSAPLIFVGFVIWCDTKRGGARPPSG